MQSKNNQALQRVNGPDTDTQRTDNGSRAQDNRHPNKILPKSRQSDNTISTDTNPDAAVPVTPYAGAYTADPAFDTESKTNDVLTFDKFGYDGLLIETDADNPINSPSTSLEDDNLSDIQTVVIKPDTPPSEPEDEYATTGFESYYTYSTASTYTTTPIVR